MLNYLITRRKDLVVFILFITLLFLFLTAIIVKKPERFLGSLYPLGYDLHQIQERDTLIAITDNTSSSYFSFRGQPMGYQYELLQNLTEHLDVELRIVVENDIEESFRLLNEGVVDLIAVDLTITQARSKKISFCDPHSQTHQVLVQKKPEGWEKMRRKELEDTLLRNQLDIGGKTIHIQKGSAYRIRLQNLSEEIGDSIDIKEVDIETEDLISMVSEGKIKYAISDEHIARSNATWYDNIDYKTAISFPQNVAWAVRHTSDSLKYAIDHWLGSFTNSRKYKQIFRKYFVSKKPTYRSDPEFHSIAGGRISKYDPYFKKYAEGTGFDWRFVASLAYEESRFKATAKSWAGAQGLMQLMPTTAGKFGVTNPYDPEQQVRGGVKFLLWLDKQLPESITEREERNKFILASYNIGLGHVLDAWRLAEKYGEDPNSWAVTEVWLTNKSQAKYYTDPVVRSGYARGRETRRFVKSVYSRFKHYENLVPVD